MIEQSFVLDKLTKKVLRYGYCDFTNDGSFLPDTEEIISTVENIGYSIEEKDAYWNSGIQKFQETPIS
jgi:hypothetical protein